MAEPDLHDWRSTLEYIKTLTPKERKIFAQGMEYSYNIGEALKTKPTAALNKWINEVKQLL